MEWSTSVENPVLHVVVVGFHHKKGCQVEYSYPPLIEGRSVDSNECPSEWKHLPSLALPDGAHNFLEDTVYFQLPSLEIGKPTVYGVSCYRQINSTELLNRGTDVTRNTVQKSVCVLSRLPVFGLIQAKLELITHAYFQGRDFSQVTLLEETYKTLNISLTETLLKDSQVFLGLSCRELLQQYQHKILVLFKLMLLERRVLFYSSPVKPICTSLLTTISLFPGLIERGLTESANYTSSRPFSPTLETVKSSEDGESFLTVRYKDEKRLNQNEEMNTTSTINSNQSEKNNSNNENLKNNNTIKESEDVSSPVQIHSDNVLLSTQVNSKSVSPVTKVNSEKSVSLLTKVNSDSVSSPTIQCFIEESLGLDAENKSPDIQKLHCVGEHSSIFGSCPRKREKPGDVKDDNLVIKAGGEVNFPSVESNMEELLEREDELDWEADKLLLEINEVLDDESSASHSHVEGKADFERADSISSIASKSSEISFHSLTGGGIAKVGAGIKDKLVGLWDHVGPAETKLVITADGHAVTSPSPFVTDEFGFPLAIFTKGMLCHPYLSLHLYDLLNDINVRGFVIGATNALFKQKTNLLDAIVELSESKIEIYDPELRRALVLTTADLRFADHLVKSISDDKGDIYLDDTEWEGGDDWLRSQFKAYLLSLLATVSRADEKLVEDFNPSFTAMWKTTQNYKQWKSQHHPGMEVVAAEHLFHGQLSMSDVKLKINQVIQSADRNKRINAVVNQTGRVVSQTGKAVGAAVTSAKSAMTTWFSGLSGSKV